MSGASPSSTRPLALDLGANDGADTDYLRAKGYRVVAVEANPALAQRLRARFPATLEDDAVHVEAAAVASEVGEIDFFLSEVNDHWSSCSEAKAAFASAGATRIRVPAITLDALVAAHGWPALVKADIEGQEEAVLRSLEALLANEPLRPRPYFVVELAKESAGALFASARAAGYRVGKLVNQIHAPGSRSVRTLSGERITHAFPVGCAGPMQDDLPDEHWLDLDELERRYRMFRELRALDPRELTPGWLDLHLSPERRV